MKQGSSVLVFPLGGLDESTSYRSQKAYPGGVFTTPDALNVRGFEWATDRARGGSRPGLSRYYYDRTHDAHSIQDINQMFLAYVPPTTSFSYWVGAKTVVVTDGGYTIGKNDGTVAVDAVVNDETFASSCWDHRTGVAYVATTGLDESPTSEVFAHHPTKGSLWSNTLPESADAITGMVVIDRFLYVGWFNALGSPTSRIYKLSLDDGSIVGDPDPWVDADDYAGLVFSANSINCLAQLGHRHLGVQTSSSTGRFSVWDVTLGGDRAPLYTSASQGTYSTSRSCKCDSDGEEFFYTAAPVTGGKIQKVKRDATVVWSYTPVSDDNVLTYDKPAYRVMVLSRDNNNLYTVDAGTGSLVTTETAPLTGGQDLCSDWRGNVILWANSVASDDVRALNAELDAIWTATVANAGHDGASALRTSDPYFATRVRLLVVSGGRVHRATRDGATPVTTNPNSLDPGRPVVFSAQNGLYMYYVDGGTYRRYNADTDAMEDWTASAGTMPIDSTGRKARLIANWNGRIVLSGLPNDPQNVFFSAIDDPTDWDYAPAFATATQAYALNASNMGLIGQRVTALIPYNDDVLIVGCDGTIWQITGDPMAGGRIDNLSRETGIAWGESWCFGPDKQIFFFSTRGGVYTLVPGGSPQRISQQITGRLQVVDTSENVTMISMVWDDRAQGLFVFISPLNYKTEAIHYFWDKRFNAWWPAKFANRKHNPKCCHPYDGDDPNDRIVLIGSWDSHVRAPDSLTGKDDTEEFDSYVAIGPILAPGGGEVKLSELQAMMGKDSGAVEYKIVSANDAQTALAKFPDAADRSGEFAAGRNPTSDVLVAGHTMYVYVVGRTRWAIEGLRAVTEHLGWVRARNF